MEKRLISLMLAGTMLGAVGALAACDEKRDGVVRQGDLSYDCRCVGTNLIVALREKLVTLHKADVYTLVQISGRRGWATLNMVDTACGKGTIYTSDLVIYDYMPDETAYDVLCERCFGNN